MSDPLAPAPAEPDAGEGGCPPLLRCTDRPELCPAPCLDARESLIRALTADEPMPLDPAMREGAGEIADIVLASDWLAEVRRTAAKETAERIAEAIEARNERHGNDCLCLVCESFRECARVAREEGRA